ncbi:hypothetical protein MBEHAL_1512 [Halarchaeum acidiphilum MH1-52-1]|uniref:Branched-chain amino acid transport n=1 Tax=Halarchaeum acidiphilum MH1-52-1 TaxID=1261545 RepID=U2YVF5_9EURY|nr:AzlD domain-containing protein [Halarchaeum acidiphilum]GAD52752.1 hypothetical protein MBEHAL_1512 [Halarchaeum acidiphilum MH1-52-1]
MIGLDVGGVAAAAIAGMAVVTYLTRIGGFWLLGRLSLSPMVRAWLEYVPGTILVALVAPELLQSGPPGWLAGAGVVLVAWRTDSLLSAMLVGIVLNVGFRTIIQAV